MLEAEGELGKWLGLVLPFTIGSFWNLLEGVAGVSALVGRERGGLRWG